MSADDVACNLQTIARLQERVAVLSALKDSLLVRNRELEEQLRQLNNLRGREVYERDCLLIEITDLRLQIERMSS